MTLFIGTTPHFGSVIVAQEEGFFDKAGLPVEITIFASGWVATEAFQGGRGNAVNCGDFAGPSVWRRGAGVGVCPSTSRSSVREAKRS